MQRFDVVFTLVHRARDDRVFLHQPFAAGLMSESLLILPQHVVVRNVLSFEQHRIACRKVEYHYVVALDSAQSLEAVDKVHLTLSENDFLVFEKGIVWCTNGNATGVLGIWGP